MFKKGRIGNWTVAFVLSLVACKAPEVNINRPLIKIAILDTGYAHQSIAISSKICNTDEHYDFSLDKPVIGYDKNGHGSNVVRTIVNYAGEGNYCFLIYKVTGEDNLASADSIAKALMMGKKYGATIFNISLSGYGKDFYSKEEHTALLSVEQKAERIFIAAGNNKKNLNLGCYSYPACYIHAHDSVVIVGSRSNTLSNYGRVVSIKEKFCYDKFCGTSASTAIATGKYIGEKVK